MFQKQRGKWEGKQNNSLKQAGGFDPHLSAIYPHFQALNERPLHKVGPWSEHTFQRLWAQTQVWSSAKAIHVPEHIRPRDTQETTTQTVTIS